MIAGKAKELFLKWFREEKQLSGFDDESILTKIFALSEWLKINGYSISIKSSYYNSDYSATISFNEGDILTQGHKSLEKALLKAIEIGINEFNESLT
jgi:hypothetical protein